MTLPASNVSTESRYDLSRARLVELSLTDVGATGPNGAPTPNMRAHANDLLNSLVQDIDVNGEMLWRTVRRELATIQGTNGYTLGTDVWDVDDPMNIRRSGTTARSRVSFVDRDYFMSVSDRTIQGLPTQFYVERTIGVAGQVVTIYLMQTPDATGDTVEYAAMLKAKTYADESNTGDFPAKWLRTLRYGLDVELSATYKSPRASWFQAQYATALEKVLADSGQGGNVRFVPYMNGGG